MISSFASKKTQNIFEGRLVKNIHPDLQKKALRRLRYIDAAERIEDLKIPPSNKLEKKKGDLKDFYAIWVNAQFRIIFRWDNGNAYDVELVDYH
jgi:proteic killer suppression protein